MCTILARAMPWLKPDNGTQATELNQLCLNSGHVNCTDLHTLELHDDKLRMASSHYCLEVIYAWDSAALFGLTQPRWTSGSKYSGDVQTDAQGTAALRKVAIPNSVHGGLHWEKRWLWWESWCLCNWWNQGSHTLAACIPRNEYCHGWKYLLHRSDYGSTEETAPCPHLCLHQREALFSERSPFLPPSQVGICIGNWLQTFWMR